MTIKCDAVRLVSDCILELAELIADKCRKGLDEKSCQEISDLAINIQCDVARLSRQLPSRRFAEGEFVAVNLMGQEKKS